jgi:AcrR family transcriptional regulator
MAKSGKLRRKAAAPGSKDSRREEITTAAWAAFGEKGFAGTTMHEIARKAHASKETLYTWFGDKETLFETVLLERLRTIGSSIAEAAPSFSPDRILYLIARDLLGFISSPGTMALLRIATADAPRFARINLALAQSLSRPDFAAALRGWRSLGLMEFDDAEEAASMFMAMAQGEWPTRLAYGVVKGMTDAQIDRHAKLATKMFLKAVAPSKT